MNTHETPELLSSYLDGELDDAGRASIEAHLSSCAECSRIVDAVRATVTEMRALEVPEPVGSAALRAAVARARGRGKRAGRWSAAIAGAAAAAIGIAALTLNGESPPQDAGALRAGAVPLVDATDYNRTTVRALLIPTATALDAVSEAQTTSRKNSATRMESDPYAFSAGAPSDDLSAEVAACDRASFANNTDPRTLERAIVATYERKPALLLVYLISPPRAEAHRELWVLSRPGCDVLYWADTKA